MIVLEDVQDEFLKDDLDKLENEFEHVKMTKQNIWTRKISDMLCRTLKVKFDPSKFTKFLVKMSF